MKKNNEFGWFVALGLLPLVSAACHAASGTVDFSLSANVNVYAVEMGDTIVTARGGNGTVTFIHSSGRPFVEGASATVQYASFSKKTPSGLELEADAVATFSSEDTLLMLFVRHPADPGTSGEGTVHLMGGSGRFAGISGQCKYKMDDPPGAWNVTVAQCQWVYSFPYR
ncbi:MAG: hypothetical protein ABI728_05540 [Betaproteobacteria bacterium]